MNPTPDPHGLQAGSAIETYGLIDSLNHEWIKLPLEVMKTAGPAVQTLGGLLKITNRETYVCVAKIAQKARLPEATVRKHLAALHTCGLIVNEGRQATRGGILRRTATIKIPRAVRDRLEPYGILPWWFAWQKPWCARAVLSVWMARLCSLKRTAEVQYDSLGVLV